MIKLKKLSFSGIGRFVDKQVVNVASLGSMVQVDGQREDTGGSSGSGKSTVFNAHDYLLGLNDLSAGILQSRLTKDGIWVEGIYDYNGSELIISRSKAKGLVVQVGDDTPITGSKLAEEKLDEILGMSRDLFRKTIHKRQKEGGFFLELGPSETHEFLSKCLNLEEFSSKIEKLDARIKELSDKNEGLSSALTGSRASLIATQDGIVNLGLPPYTHFNEDKIKELIKAYEDAKEKHENLIAYKQKITGDATSEYKAATQALQEKQKVDIGEIEKERPELVSIPFDRTNIEKFEKGVSILKSKIDAIKKYKQEKNKETQNLYSSQCIKKHLLENFITVGVSSRKKAQEIALEIKKIRDSLCPTCEQSWATETAKAREEVLLGKVKELKELVLVGASAEQELEVLVGEINQTAESLAAPEDNTEIDQINLKIVDINSKLVAERLLESKHQAEQNSANSVALKQFKIKEDVLRKHFLDQASSISEKWRTRLDEIETQLALTIVKAAEDRNLLANNVDKIMFEKKSYETSLARYQDQLKSFKLAEQSHQEKADVLSVGLYCIEKELLLAEEAKKLVKSYISCSFDDALDAIGDTATRIIRNIPNMANATIQLEGTKETKSGKIKEEVNAVISVDGEQNVPIKSLSGGERSSVDLAVDLAVIDLIHTKSGKGMDIFILDEPFNGLDPVSIEMALEVLKNCNVNKKLIIVSHDSELKQMVENRIVVVRDGASSSISANE